MVKSVKYKGIWLHKLLNGDITYYIQYIDNKKRNRKVKIGRRSEGISEHWCYQKRNEIIHKSRLENFSLDEKKDAPLFDEVAFMYFEWLFNNGRSVENTESTVVRYKKHLQKYVGHRSILDIDIVVLNKIKRDKIQILAPRTVNGYLSLISTILNYGNRTLDLQIKNHINNRNVAMFKEDNIRERFLSKDEINLLLENVKNYRQVNLATRFALATGARLGTVLSIKVRDINPETRVIKLTDHKSGGDRYNSYLHEKYFPDFKFLNGRKPNEWIFSYKGNRIEGASVQLQFRVIANRLFNEGLDKDDRKHRVVFHTLRHTFCSQLCIAGVDLYRVQKLIHHKSSVSTQRYAKLSQENLYDSLRGAFDF